MSAFFLLIFKTFQVPPGEYRISALSAAPESSPELLFLPPYADVVVKGPIFNVEFSQVNFLFSRKVGILFGLRKEYFFCVFVFIFYFHFLKTVFVFYLENAFIE